MNGYKEAAHSVVPSIWNWLPGTGEYCSKLSSQFTPNVMDREGNRKAKMQKKKKEKKRNGSNIDAMMNNRYSHCYYDITRC